MIARGKRGDWRQGQKRRVFSWLVVLLMVLSLFTPQFANVVSADADGVPDHSKSATPNGDGTYTLELSVTGDADTEVETAANVNVLVVYDVSNSMTSSAGQGSRYSRADQAEDVVHDFIVNLRGYQSSSDPSNIQMALVTFARTGSVRQTHNQNWTSDLTDNNGINRFFDDGGTDGTTKLTYTGTASYGTNWQSALTQAQTLLNNAPDDDPTFVIFVTDGAPTASGNGNNAISPNSRLDQLRPFYEAGLAPARAIQNRQDTTMFGIYAYGTEADLLDDLMYYANTGTERTIGSGTVPTDNYYNAGNTTALNEAIESIFHTIVNALGIESVAISDGTTHEVETSTGEISELLEVDEDSYQYWLTIPIDASNHFQRVDLVSGETVTYTVSSDGKTVTWGSNSVTVNGEIFSEGGRRYLKYEWKEKNALYNFDPPKAKLNSGSVDWNLSSVKTLLDGVKYSVTFKVYPSQETLDDVADIMNNPGANGAWKDLDPVVQQYIDVDGNLKTNTTATLTYSDTRLDNPGPKTSTYTNPDPVPNSAVEQMAITKEWDNALTEEWEKPDGIVLNVTRDDDPHYTVTLSEANEWKGSVYVSIGIMGADGQPLEGSEGHDFTFTEPTIQGSDYKWEIDAPTVHPMLINNKPTMLIKVDEKHPIPSGATTYAFNDATYYVDDEVVSLTATNERRSSINLVKTVTGEDVPEDAVFPFTLNVTDPLAPATAPTQTEDPNHDSDYWVWISVRDMSGTDDPDAAPPVTDAVVSGATHAGGGWYYGESGKDIVLNVKDGYSIRINNVPVGTTYTITEGNNLPTGFVFEGADIEFTDGRQPDPDWAFTGNQTSTGSVDSTNAVYTITYTNKYELRDITVDKIWDDASNQDGVRPTELALTLNGMPAGTTAPTPIIEKNGNTWTYTWKAVPKYDADGEEIAYTVTENTVPDEYTCTDREALDGESITNSHTPELIDIPVEKVWNDEDDQDGIRPDSVTVKLLADGADTGKTLVLSKNDTDAAKNFKGSFTDLPKYKDGKEIQYTIQEVEAGVITGEDGPGTYGITEYGKSTDGTLTVTNKHTPETTTYTVTKAWNDANNKDGKRPDSVTVALYADGTQVGETEELTEADGWTKTWSKLPKYKNGQPIVYTADETVVPAEYTKAVDHAADGLSTTVTNSHVSDKTQYTVTKAWVDNNNQDGIRPPSINVQLYQDGEKYGDEITLVPNPTAAQQEQGYGPWSYTWTGLELNKDVTVEETTTPDNGSKAVKAEATEEPAADEAQADDEVQVDDENVTEEEQPAGGDAAIEEQPADEAAEDEQGDTDKRNAPTRAAAAAHEYVAREVGNITGYTSEVTESTPTSATITNTHTPEVVNVEITKKWNDENDQDGYRLTAEEFVEKVHLYGNGVLIEDATPTVRDNSDNTYTVTFSNLPKNAAGEEITYTVKEDEIPEYTTDNTEVANGGTITNTHIPEKEEITVTKVWVDADNQDGKRPADVDFTVTGSDNNTYETTLTGSGNTWTSTIEVDKYYNHGQEVTFEVDEETVAGYTKEIDNSKLTITNTYNPETTNVEITKEWVDANDQDGYRPTAAEFKAKLHLYMTTEADGKVEVTSQYADQLTVEDNGDGTYTVSVANLPMFKPGSIGSSITWTIGEGEIDHYTAVGASEVGNGETITNKHDPDKTQITVNKIWEDADDQDGMRPEKITVDLMADGEKADSAELTEATGWAATFDNLDVYKEGEKIEYSIDEVEVDGYTVEIGDLTEVKDEETGEVTGYTVDITNTHEPEQTQITVNKIWEDADDQDGMRPEKITVDLMADGEKADSAELTEETEWAATFDNLDVYKDGEKIEYSIDEVEVDGYTVEIGDLTEVKDEETGEVTGYTVDITNTHEPEQTQITVNKIWEDADDQDGMRPEKITVDLMADGEKADSAELTEATGWAATFDNLDVYKDGEKIEYSIDEVEVDGYTVEIGDLTEVKDEETGEVTGYTVDITNTHEPETVYVDGLKKWEGEADEAEEALRPESITVNLLADGAPVLDEDGKAVTDTVTADDNWAFEFTDLPKYKDHGTKIVYTVTEDPVDGYKVSISNPKDVTEEDSDRVAGYEIEITNTIDVKPAAEGTELNIKKVNEENIGLEGVKFTLNPEEGSEAEPIEVTTDKNGEATIEIPVKEGWLGTDEHEQDEYTFELTEDAPTGYVAAGPWTVTVVPEVGEDGKIASYTIETETADDGTKTTYWQRLIHWIVDNVEGAEGDTAVYEGKLFTITNVKETVDVPVEKIWEEEDPRYDIRPESITVNLLADEEETDKSLELSDENEWKDTFADLDKYSFDENGKAIAEIDYTVDEIEVTGYDSAIEATEDGGFIITNTMKFGDVRITKDLQTYEDSSQATFVYSVKATVKVGDKDVTVYDGVVTLDFTSATTASAVIEHLPAGAVVEVEETYSGAAYDQKSGPDWDVDDQTIKADEVIGVEFSNAYNGELTQGYGILNECEAEGGDWVNLKQIVNSNEPEKEPEE